MFLIPLAIFWSLAIWGFLSRKPVLVYLFFCSMAFGSVAVVPSQLTAGLTFTPTPIVALLIIARTLGNRSGLNFLLTAALTPSKLFLLFSFWLIAVATTLFMPRLFAGYVQVIPVRGNLGGSAPLLPTPQNISQLAYITISILTVFAFTRLLRSDYHRWHSIRAVIFGGVAVAATGIVDYATQFIPVAFLLEPFRTATYALLVDVQVLGGKRVIGLMPEASSYGALCLGFLSFLYFLRSSIDDSRLRERYLPILIGLLAILLWQATSSSAYVGMAMLGLCAALNWSLRAIVKTRSVRHRRLVKLEFFAVLTGLFLIVAVIAFKPDLVDPITRTLDRMVFQKTSSHSYEERNMWTAVSWQAALDTYGFGVGLGSTRPSNAFVAVVSSTGFLGGALYYGFVVYLLTRRTNRADSTGAQIANATRWALIPGMGVGLLAATLADFGLLVAFQFAVLMSHQLPWSRQASVRALQELNNLAIPVSRS